MKTPTLTLEAIIKTAIYDNKMELIAPSREYNDNEIAYLKGYIQSLEDMLYELEGLNDEELPDIYKIHLN